MEFETKGRHYIADFYGVHLAFINEEYLLKHACLSAELCGASVLSFDSHDLGDKVVVGLILSESHLTIHATKSKRTARLDCYTCGDNADPQIAIQYLKLMLMPLRSHNAPLKRGQGELDFLYP